MPESPAADLPYRAAASSLAFLLLTLLALVVIHISLEKGRRKDLEQFVELTAVGDTQWYHLPSPLPATPVAAATFGGRPLVPVTYRKIEMREPRVTKVGQDDAGTLRIYVTHEPNAASRDGENERHGEPVYFLKVGPDEFLKVQPAAAAR